MHRSVFELYRIGPGPSSSHTVGPLRAARRFLHDLAAEGAIAQTHRIEVDLLGSLGSAGRDHGSDRAVIAGLSGVAPESCDARMLEACAATARAERAIRLGSRQQIRFDPTRDIRFRVDSAVAYDGNALRFAAFDANGTRLCEKLYFSPGDGDVVAEWELVSSQITFRVPYPFSSAATLLVQAQKHRKKPADLVLANECASRSPGEVRAALVAAAKVMRGAIEHGLAVDGVLPGGTARRARAEAERLRHDTTALPLRTCAVYALAVAEENAAGGRVVGAPSNGAAGPVAALLAHWLETTTLAGDDGIAEFLLTAAAIASLLRASGLTQAGCQSEVGVAAAMAAAGRTAVLDGTAQQILHAAEVALAPHLGLACDPAGGRVESPCIERNALAARRAYTASEAAIHRSNPPNALDALVRSMVESGRAMAGRYKQASVGGVAVSVADC